MERPHVLPSLAARAPALAASNVAAATRVRVAFAGGGTGGHILPGRHVLEWARTQDALEDLLWFQTGRAVEDSAMRGVDELVRPSALERVALRLEPDGGGAPSLPRLGWFTLPAARRARRALARHRSQVVLALGGFTSVPVALAARSLGIPIALLEINASSGKATQWLAPLAARVLHAWSSTLPAGNPTKHRWVGPPLAPKFARGAPSAEAARAARAELGFETDLPLLVVLGGSQGAKGLNRFVAAQASFFSANGVQVLHQTGPGRASEGANVSIPGYRAIEYVHDVHCALTAASFVLCRGGASTLAEVGALARPVAVVPYPHHADRHQEKNARELGDGAHLVDESELDLAFARELVRCVGPLGDAEREAMTRALAERVPREGASRVWSELAALARRDFAATIPAPAP